MALIESLDVFLADFGTTVTKSTGATFTAIFDHPDEIIAGGMVMTTSYKLTAKYSDVSSLANGDTLRIAKIQYLVKEVRQTDDGSFAEVYISKA